MLSNNNTRDFIEIFQNQLVVKDENGKGRRILVGSFVKEEFSIRLKIREKIALEFGCGYTTRS